MKEWPFQTKYWSSWIARPTQWWQLLISDVSCLVGTVSPVLCLRVLSMFPASFLRCNCDFHQAHQGAQSDDREGGEADPMDQLRNDDCGFYARFTYFFDQVLNLKETMDHETDSSSLCFCLSITCNKWIGPPPWKIARHPPHQRCSPEVQGNQLVVYYRYFLN